MTPVEFKSEFRHRTSAAAVTVYPAGWRGAVEDDIAKAARKAGALKARPQKKATAEAAPKEDEAGAADRRLAGMTVSDLRARAESQGIDLGKATKKADIIAVLEAAGSGGDEAAQPGDAGVSG